MPKESFTSFIIFFALALVLPSLVLSEELRVTNGAAADEGEYPFMVSLIERGTEPALDLINCGGTLIHERYVLTAAHCVFDFFGDPVGPKAFQVITGRTTLSSDDGEFLDLKRVIPHPDYDDFRFVPNGDLAILKLDGTPSLSPLPLASEEDSESLSAGDSLLILGWGISDPDALSVFPDTLQEGTVPFVAESYCDSVYGLVFNNESMVCAAQLSTSEDDQDGIDTCSGDSGGPLIGSFSGTQKQVGITSFGFRCEDTKFPGVYTSVAAYREWIDGIVNVGAEIEDLLAALPDQIRQAKPRKNAKKKKTARQSLRQSLNRIIELHTSSRVYVLSSFPEFSLGRAKALRRHALGAVAISRSVTERTLASSKVRALIRKVTR